MDSSINRSLGPLIVDIAGTSLTPEDRAILTHSAVGGLILFSRNFQSRQQLTALCAAIRETRATPLLIMVDQEGGNVQRFKHEFTVLPQLTRLGQLADLTGPEMIKNAGWLMAIELLSIGIDFSLAPVLDLNKGISSVIGNRAFHRDPEKVSDWALLYMQGMAEAGMAATGKHFPGHGSVAADSHLTLPIDTRHLNDLFEDDLIPFMRLIAAHIPALMAAHLVYPAIDNTPVGFSAYWLKTILRERLGFTGVIFSDDLNMAGAESGGGAGARVLQALTAGCDFTLLCNNRAGVVEALACLERTPHWVPAVKWQSMQGKRITEPYLTNARWRDTHDLLQAS